MPIHRTVVMPNGRMMLMRVASYHLEFESMVKMKTKSQKQDLKERKAREGKGKEEEREGREKKKERKKKEKCYARKNLARRTQSQSHDLRVTSRPNWKKYHVTKPTPPLFNMHHHLPWILALYIHLLEKNLTFQMFLRGFHSLHVSAFISTHGLLPPCWQDRLHTK
jgi:ATPase subunit of ABC transporter with duplicated ATPase domains